MTCYDSSNEQLLVLSLAACVESSLRDCGDICSFQVVPGGAQAIDTCGCDDGCEGHGWLTVLSGSAYTTFGSEVLTEGCQPLLQVDIEVGLLRCYPVQEDPIDPSVLTELSMTLISDMMALRTGLTCCPDTEVLLGAYRALPPSGGCVGGAWRAVLGLG